MKLVILPLFSCLLFFNSYAGRISGWIKDPSGEHLAYASVSVKGTSKGAVANSQGFYSLVLQPGSYTLVCQFVGYHSEEKTITVSDQDQSLNFVLSVQELKMDAVVIKNGKDPALEIMREAIKKREHYNSQVDSFTVDVYIKGLLRTRVIPEKFMGKSTDKAELEKEGFDSMGRGILYLSESLTKTSFARPDHYKYEVISTHQSGGGYGFSFPTFTNFYVNNVAISTANPRGFISPLADAAFHYYKFHYEGNFFEGDKMIDRIRVTPKRKNEPLFNGYLQIVDGEWRIHSLDLFTTQQNQLEIFDTIRITQLQAPVTADIWRTRNQVTQVALNLFGLEVAGSFLNVYSNYNLVPHFDKKYFGNVFMKYDTAAMKRDSSYWSAARPLPLETEEQKDFRLKDSLRTSRVDSFSRMGIDTLKARQKPIKFQDLILGDGITRSHYDSSKIASWRLKPLASSLSYNTVEGLAINMEQSFEVRPRTGKNNYAFGLDTRYGISNEHLNVSGSFSLRPKADIYRNRFLKLSGGRRITQFNRDNPIDPFTNSIYTLFYKKNYIKLYENWFGSMEYNNRMENGLKWNISTSYEDRRPLENTTGFAFSNKTNLFLPNHPYELDTIPFTANRALVAAISVAYQPGQRYIQYGQIKTPMGSSYPTLELQYSKGIKNWMNSDADFDKWRFSVYDNMNFKLGGELRYRFSAGGFLNSRHVDIPDFQHFNGNQTLHNFKYLNSFQLAPYYRYSNTEKLYGVFHLEYHLNGLLTNKIPLFNQLKWHLVVGSNTFYVNRNNYYAETFAGVENILKMFRVDFISAYQTQPGNRFGIRVGLGGVIGGLVQVKR